MQVLEEVERVTEHKRLTTKEKYPHGAEGVSKDKLTGKYCRGVFEATACVEKLAEYETAEEEGRLVVLPVGIGDEVYIIEKCSNIPERLDGTLYDSDGWIGTATGYYCPYENNCPFGDDDFTICDDYKEKLAVFKDYVDEIHIRENEVFIFTENTCQYCSFGKTVFLTREEAEKALKEMKIK